MVGLYYLGYRGLMGCYPWALTYLDRENQYISGPLARQPLVTYCPAVAGL